MIEGFIENYVGYFELLRVDFVFTNIKGISSCCLWQKKKKKKKKKKNHREREVCFFLLGTNNIYKGRIS